MKKECREMYPRKISLRENQEKIDGNVVFKELKGSTKNVCANVDLFSGLVYRILGISEELFTPIFAISRVAGWCAHRMEEVEFANRIIRPAYKYVGDEKQYISLEKR